MSDGNGKLPGQIDFSWPPDGVVEPELSRAIEWLRHGVDGRHRPGCQCTPCINAVRVTRRKVAESPCICGWCFVCWAANEIKGGRL